MSVCKCCYKDQWWKIEYCFLFALLRDPVVVCLCTTPVPCRAETFSVGHGSFGFREYFIARYLFFAACSSIKVQLYTILCGLSRFLVGFPTVRCSTFFCVLFLVDICSVCVCVSVFVFLCVLVCGIKNRFPFVRIWSVNIFLLKHFITFRFFSSVLVMLNFFLFLVV